MTGAVAILVLKHLVCRGMAVKGRTEDESTAATGRVLEVILNTVVTLLPQDESTDCNSFFCTCTVQDILDSASATWKDDILPKNRVERP